MEITKELLQQKIQEYRQASEQCKMDSIANEGAIQALEFLLQEFDKEENKKAVSEG